MQERPLSNFLERYIADWSFVKVSQKTHLF